jgi:hypothetical protein
MEEIILPLLQQGVLGIGLVAVTIAYMKKDQRIKELNDEKLELAERVFKMVSTLADTLERKK